MYLATYISLYINIYIDLYIYLYRYPLAMYNLSITTHWFLSGSLHVAVEWEIALCSFDFVSDRPLSSTLLWMVLDSTRYYLLYVIASHILFHYNGYIWLFQVCGITMGFFPLFFQQNWPHFANFPWKPYD